MCLSGTDEYIRYVVETYSTMLLRLAMTRVSCTADAEDAVQEVFLRLVQESPGFRDPEHEKAWLIRATIHRCCDMNRKASRRALPLEAAETVPAIDGTGYAELLSAVQALPEKYSTVIHLYYFEGYSLKEIGKLLRLPVPTVGTRLSRGRERLKKLLDENLCELC